MKNYVWTKRTPEPGWYWCRLNDSVTPFIIQIKTDDTPISNYEWCKVELPPGFEAELNVQEIMARTLDHYYAEPNDWGMGQMNIEKYILKHYSDIDKFFYAKTVKCVDWECCCIGDECTCGAPSEREITANDGCVFVYLKDGG